MTEEQRLLFSQIVDLNWDYEQEKDWKKKFDLAHELNKKKQELINLMGKKEYDNFIEMGRQMFADRQEEPVDTSYEQVED